MVNKRKTVLFVVGAKNFRDEEYFQPRVILQSKGFDVVTSANTNEEEATGTMGGKARVDVHINKVKPANYDAIVFVGGSGAQKYFKNKTAFALVKEFIKNGKVVGAICIAPSILANAGVLRAKKATCFSTEKQNLIQKGAIYIDQGVMADGKIVTAQGPDFAASFGEELVKALE